MSMAPVIIVLLADIYDVIVCLWPALLRRHHFHATKKQLASSTTKCNSMCLARGCTPITNTHKFVKQSKLNHLSLHRYSFMLHPR